MIEERVPSHPSPPLRPPAGGCTGPYPSVATDGKHLGGDGATAEKGGKLPEPQTTTTPHKMWKVKSEPHP